MTSRDPAQRARLSLRPTAVLAAIFFALVASVLTVSSAQAAATNIRVLQMNIAGGQFTGGPENGGKMRAVQPVIDKVTSPDDPDPEVITLQEVCKDQATHLIDKLSAHGYKWHWRKIGFQDACSAQQPGAANEIGDLVAVKSAHYVPTANAGYHVFGDPWDDDKIFVARKGDGLTGATCIRFTYGGRTNVACSTHLPGPTGGDLRQENSRNLDAWARAWDEIGWGVIIAGDFNSSPDKDWMRNRLYQPGVGSGAPGGIFNEADQLWNCTKTPGCANGRFTHNNVEKIDYVFMSTRMSVASSMALQLSTNYMPSYSDHARLYASAAVK